MPLVFLGLLVGLPFVLALIFRVHALFIFISLLAGNVLVYFLGDDAGLVAAMVSKSSTAPLVAKGVLLLLPVVLTFVFLRRTLSVSKIAFTIVPLLATCMSIAVLAVPLLTTDLQQQVFGSPSGNILKQAQDDIIGVAVISNLLLMWLTFRKTAHHGKKHH